MMVSWSPYIIGAGIFARLYPGLNRLVLNYGTFPADTIPELLGIRAGVVVIMVALLITGFLYGLAVLGF